jgi:hypothetical protein
MSYAKWIQCESFNIESNDPSFQTVGRTVEKASTEPLAVTKPEEMMWLIFMMCN